MPKYTAPEMEIVKLDREDTITTSNCSPYTLPINDEENQLCLFDQW
ncbi:MAG: hypothetical protein MJ132_02860 [Clostridia bacterium]|nr:hypothetical protein [Clostridia bacterium]